MNKIMYILKRLKSMDKKAMIRKINEIHEKTGMSKVKIFMDMRRVAVRYGAGYMDYDLFEMYNLTETQRDTYLTRGRNNELVLKYCDKSKLHYFMNKDEFNTEFNEYIKRDWIDIKTSSKEQVLEFIKKHEVFMAKPIDGGCGKGIEKIRPSEFESHETLYEYLTREGTNYELEELIIQHAEVSKIYPGSINTVRIVTVVTTKEGDSLLQVPEEKRHKDNLTTHIIAAFFRIGNGNKFVDNFNSGGMAAPVNVETGIVSQVAIDKQKNIYEKHPLTNEIIKGFKFPYWEEAIKMCKEAAHKIPEMGYVGWDVAFTPNGPVLVEGNEFPGHDIYQLPAHTPDKIGIYPKFNFKENIAKEKEEKVLETV